MLTQTQKKDLNKAILEYLSSQDGFQKTQSAFMEESGLKMDGASSGLLEKKWTSVIRLQKKLLELEQKNTELQELVKSGGGAIGSTTYVLMLLISLCPSANLPGRMRTTRGKDALPIAPASKELLGHRSPITCVVVHPTFNVIVSSSEDGTVKVWDGDAGVLEKTLNGHTNSVNCVCFDPAGTVLASASSDATIKLWNLGKGVTIRSLNGHDHTVSQVVFSPDSSYLYSCSRDKTIRTWELNTGFCARTFHGHSDWVRTLALSPDGRCLFSGSSDKSVRLWNAAKGECMAELYCHDHVVEDVKWSACKWQDGSKALLASASRDMVIILYECVQSSLTVLCRLEAHDNWVRGLEFHPNGQYLLSVSDDKNLLVWNLEKRKVEKKLLSVHQHFVSALTLSPKQFTVVTGSVDNSLKVWDCA